MLKRNILVTGGAGYVGAVLIPKLINAGHSVRVVDLFMYGEDVFNESNCDKTNLDIVKGDIRDLGLIKKSLEGIDTVIHLACISNDPSFDLNPSLGKSINLSCFRPLVEASIDAGVNRFVYASSSSVYGVKDEPNVHEDMTLEPLTDYSRFKAECEKILLEYESENFTTTIIRPATVCGYSPRQRLDVIVNILTNHAHHNKKIKVFGGEQKRPNIHIQDMTDLYVKLMVEDKKKISGKTWNAGYENHTVNELAESIHNIFGDSIEIQKTETDDNRSYHVSSEKISKDIGFKPTHSIEEAVKELKKAFEAGKLPNAMEDPRYYNIKTMKSINLV
ncbi:SDR family oxidoreductase [Bacteriovoracales bacterium]|nr:SDR family oxidoreductase [Bacteriovoracales bacterium]